MTSSLPHGPLEAFVLPEIAALERLGHEIWIVPMWPRGDRMHADAEPFRERTLSEPLLSSAVLTSAARELRPAPVARILWSRPRTAAKNLVVHPKALWLARRLRELGPITSMLTGSRRARPLRWSPPSAPGSAGA